MALDNFTAAAAVLDAAADRLIAKNASDEAALAQALGDVANVDQTATATIQPIIDKITAVVPVPEPAPADPATTQPQ